jgi:hypothetical protein
MEDQMPLAEGSALGVLPGQAHGDPTGDDRGKGELLGLSPVDLALRERRLPALHLSHQLWMNGESVRHRQQLPVQRLENLGRNRGLDIGLGRGIHRRTADLGRVRGARPNVLMGVR